MKRITGYLLVSALAVVLLTGCAVNPFVGIAYTKVGAPTIALTQKTDAATFSKVGEASLTNYLGLWATGDASLDAAMKNGGITRVHHVDCRYNVVLGVYSKFTVVVYGE